MRQAGAQPAAVARRLSCCGWRKTAWGSGHARLGAQAHAAVWRVVEAVGVGAGVARPLHCVPVGGQPRRRLDFGFTLKEGRHKARRQRHECSRQPQQRRSAAFCAAGGARPQSRRPSGWHGAAGRGARGGGRLPAWPGARGGQRGAARRAPGCACAAAWRRRHVCVRRRCRRAAAVALQRRLLRLRRRRGRAGCVRLGAVAARRA